MTPVISTPDQRLRVFVSSTLQELALEREAARSAIRTLRLTPVMLDLGSRPHPPADVYRSYLEQSDVFVGIYWESYGWVAPEATISGIDDEFQLASGMPRLIYVKEPAGGREPGLQELLTRILESGSADFRTFSSPEELFNFLVDDLAVLATESFHATESSNLQTGTLTFLFADLEGSTQLVKTMGDEYQSLLGAYHRLVTAAVTGHRGQVVSTEGDGFFCVFSSPIDAAETAHQVQLAMRSHNWGSEVSPRCRIGIHTGTATRTMEGYVGIDVHVAARIGGAAQGGQIIVSATAAGLLGDHAMAHEWQIVDLGRYELKGIGRNERLLRVDIPGIEVVAEAPRARPRASSTVPATPRPIIGRVDDVRGATEMLLRDSVRLVTLTGPGGTGKTRLAVELAHSLDQEFPDGIVFVDLSAVHDLDRFLPVVGRALGVRESNERTIPEALDAVIGDARMLLVLDNMEQLIPAATQVAEVIEALPNVKILVTSRSPLRIAWEHEYPVPPLDTPEPDADTQDIARSDAVVLFMERARAVRPYLQLTDETASVMADITRRLDGLPLAIELAAARLRVFTIEDLQARLDDLLGLLDRGSSDLPERHRTLRAAIEWSHDLLEENEKVVFRRLAVFSGGWTLDAAVAVCCDDSLGEAKVLDILEELVAKSLVVFTVDEHGVPRYRLLETLREYAFEQLIAEGEEDTYRAQHLDWCHEVAERVMNVLQTPQFVPYLDVIERERFNLREALAWSVKTRSGTDKALEVCGLLPLFFDTRGYVSEGLRWTRTLVAMTTAEGNTKPRGMALSAMGWLEMLAGDPDESDWALGASVTMFRELHDDSWLGRALSMHGMTTYNRNDLDVAERQFEEAIELCRREGLDWLADAWCGYGMAHIALGRGDFLKADSLLNSALDYSRDNGLTWGVGHVQLSRGVLAFMTGDLDQAVTRLLESLTMRNRLRDARGICDCIGVLGLLASVQGDHALAAVLVGAAEVAREASGHHPVPWLQPMIEEAMASASNALGPEYEERLEKGRHLSTDEATELIVSRFARAGTEADAVAVGV